MKKYIAALIAAIAILVGLSVPANATQESVEATVVPTNILTSYKFWPYDPAWVCVANGDNGIPIAQAAQAWNNASSGLYLDYSSNCVVDGYTPSTRMTIDTYNAADGNCVKVTNDSYAVGSDGFRRYTNNPVGWVNTNAAQGCTSTAFRRAHWTSYAIGRIIGLVGHRDVNDTTWDSRVMAYRTQDTIAWAESYSGSAISGLYQGAYVGIY